MRLTVSGNGTSEALRLNENQQSFKVTMVGTPEDEFDGKWTIQYSPDGEEWRNHEELSQAVGAKTGDLFFAIRYIRLVTEDSTKGSFVVHVIQGA